MNKRGFTLAEVLVTIGVIGVVAALTLPALNVNVQKQQAGPALAKAMNTLVNANKLAFAENDVRHLSSVNGNYIDTLSQYVSGSSDGSGGYISKDGITFSSSDFSTYPVNITVDINGAKNPNIIGKDRFVLYVYDDGAVVPYGGYEYKKYTNGSKVLWESGCNGGTITDPSSCSGAIADNGWAVKYRYEQVPISSSTGNSSSGSSSSGSSGSGRSIINGVGRIEPTIGGKIDDTFRDDTTNGSEPIRYYPPGRD